MYTECTIRAEFQINSKYILALSIFIRQPCSDRIFTSVQVSSRPPTPHNFALRSEFENVSVNTKAKHIDCESHLHNEYSEADSVDWPRCVLSISGSVWDRTVLTLKEPAQRKPGSHSVIKSFSHPIIHLFGGIEHVLLCLQGHFLGGKGNSSS